jgi:predicted sulfurtransferase
MTLPWLWKGLLLSLSIVFLNHLIVPAAFSATDGVPRITVQELKAKIDKGEDVVIIDVRTGEDYERSRIKIKGAVRIPIVQMEERYKELPKNKQIIAYCT